MKRRSEMLSFGDNSNIEKGKRRKFFSPAIEKFLLLGSVIALLSACEGNPQQEAVAVLTVPGIEAKGAFKSNGQDFQAAIPLSADARVFFKREDEGGRSQKIQIAGRELITRGYNEGHTMLAGPSVLSSTRKKGKDGSWERSNQAGKRYGFDEAMNEQSVIDKYLKNGGGIYFETHSVTQDEEHGEDVTLSESLHAVGLPEKPVRLENGEESFPPLDPKYLQTLAEKSIVKAFSCTVKVNKQDLMGFVNAVTKALNQESRREGIERTYTSDDKTYWFNNGFIEDIQLTEDDNLIVNGFRGRPATAQQEAI